MNHPVVVIIDGSSLLHRAFYAIPPLSNSQGVPTNAVFGFVNMLERLRRDFQPDYLVVALDKSRETFRQDTYQAYKANRGATPAELRPQFDLLKEVLALQGVPVFELAGYEADDLIGTLCCRSEEAGLACLVVTGDRDAWQLIRPGVEVLLTRKGITEIERYDEKMLTEKMGLTPAQVVDWKGLMGDPADNIPGVPGVGEKTALKLLKQFGSMEVLYARLPEVKGKLQERLALYKEQAFLSRELATIVCDLSLDVDWEACKGDAPDVPGLRRLYETLEFRSLLRRLPPVSVPAGKASTGVPPETGWELVDPDQLPELLTNLLRYGHRSAGKTAVLAVWEDGPRTGRLVQLALAVGCPAQSRVWVINAPEGSFGGLQPFWLSPDHPKICYDAKSLWLLARQEGIEPRGLAGDSLLAAYLLDAQAGNITLARLAAEQLGWELAPETGRAVLPAAAAAQGAVSLLHLHRLLTEKLAGAGLTSLYQTVELPLIPVLAAMEGAGVKVEPAILKQMAVELDRELNRLQLAIFDLAGDSFNINSPRQLGGILFEKLGLPVIKKTKTGYSTDGEVLDELADCHPIIGMVLEYRQLMKLKSTYVEGILPLLDPRDGRIHTTFNQMVTATGRLSSTEPNLQNIPVRLEQGRRIRRAFVVPGDGWLLLAADYSQIELRILAHLSGDPGLKEAFINQQDIHTRTASEVFGVAMSAVTPEMRHRAKAVNFGIVYGIGDFRLGRDLGVSRAEARRYIDGYFERYAGVKRYIDQTISLARKTGVVTTLLGRRRRIPELFAKNKVRQAFGERAAMNTPVQGSAADIIKAAMVNIAALLRDKGFQARMLLQVHDELIFEIPRAELPHLAPRIKAAMEQAIPLDVPLVVDLKAGSNWYEMQAYEECL